MKRVWLGVVVTAVCLVVPFSAGPASAGGPQKTTVVLTCDKNQDASVAVALQPSLLDSTFLGGASLNCGPDSISGLTRNRAVVATGSVAAGFVNVTTFTVNGGGGCVGGSTIPTRRSCPLDGSPGATLVVR
jgi:hypothetical protein